MNDPWWTQCYQRGEDAHVPDLHHVHSGQWEPEETQQSGKDSADDSRDVLRRYDVSYAEGWHWDIQDESIDITTLSCDPSGTNVTFHPHWSNGTSGVRSCKPLKGDLNFWEIHVGNRVFGTSLMFGVTTKRAKLHTTEFKNLIGGDDSTGWGLSHRGLLWHNGAATYYCKPFQEYTPVVIGILLDRVKGEITYFKDGVNLGVAFKNLHQIKEDLYPTICSTAAKTTMSLGLRLRTFMNLQERCRHAIVNSLQKSNAMFQLKGGNYADAVSLLPLPVKVKNFIRMGFT